MFSSAIIKALHNNEFVPYVQAVVEIKTNKLIGCEVLIRWVGGNFMTVSPDFFIPFCEKNELIISLARHLMDSVKKEFLAIEKILPAGFRIGFNINEKHCYAPNFLRDCQDFLGAFILNPVLLVLEITEREAFIDDVCYGNFFKALKEIDVLLSIDDFGTGYANFTHLQRFDFDFIKIDRSFINEIGINYKAKKIVSSIVSIANELGVKTVAEGVETQEQVDELNHLHVDYLQGYFYGVPTSINEFITKWIYK